MELGADADMSDAVSDASEPPDSEEILTTQSWVGVRPSLFEVQKLVYDDEPATYCLTLCGIQLRRLPGAFLCCILVAGSFCAWFTHGKFEEGMKTRNFNMWLLSLFQFGSVSLLAALSHALGKFGQVPDPPIFGATGECFDPKYRLCAMQAAVVFVSQGFANKSNHYLPYPTKMLVKASKLILVMLVKRVVFKSSSTYQQWLAVVLLAVGVGTLAYSNHVDGAGNGASIDSAEDDEFAVGMCFVLLSLVGDAFLGPMQEHTLLVVKDFELAEILKLTYGFAACIVGSVFIAEQLATAAADGGGFSLTVITHLGEPSSVADRGLIIDAVIYGFLSYIGNCMVQSLIQHFGLLLTLSTLTIRQFVTIISSYNGGNS